MKAKTSAKAGANKARANEARNTVRIDYVNPQAKSVFLAGSFNEWHPSVLEMLNIGSGRWIKEISLTPGKYEYRFVVDGAWTADPLNTEAVPNPFGGQNSVLTVSPATRV